MTLRDSFAETFSLIAQALKVSKQDERPLTRIVQIVREHFHAEACSLYEIRRGISTLIAIDENDSSLEKTEPSAQQRLVELAIEKKEVVCVQETGAAPLLHQEKVVGVLMLQKERPDNFTLSESQFLEFIALQLAGVIQSLTIAERAKLQNKTEQNSVVLKGIGVSSGFGIGPALFLNEGITSIGFSKTDLSSHSTKKEWDKLQAALRKTSEDLSHLEKRIEKKFSKEESGIFDSHRVILSDTSFLKKLEDEIDRGKGALETVGDVLQEYMQQFAKMENPRLEEAAVDLEELRQRVLENLLGMESRQEQEDWAGILVAKKLGPSDTIRLNPDKLLGIITMSGGPTSHAAILARSLGIPAVMGVVGMMENIHPGDLLIADGDKGEVIVNPGPSVLQDYEFLEEKNVAAMVDLNAIAYEPAVTLDGHLIHLEANASFVSDLKKLRYFGAEGVGLFRTEFLFLKGKDLPKESEQFDIYCQMIRDAGGLPITFRMLDAGGDKLLEALSPEKEENPFLGYRSIRLSLSQPHLLKTQFRALLRASAFGSIRILIPMISGMEELDAIQEILETVKKELSNENIPYAPHIPLGLMIEVPSAVPMVRFLIQNVDFLSIGTNDLTQYTLAVDRNNERVACFFEPLHPAVLSFISQVAEVGLKSQKPVGICGEMASDPFIIPLLVGLGITHLSMIPSCIIEAKKVIRQLNYQEAQKMAKLVLQASRIKEVKAILGGKNETARH